MNYIITLSWIYRDISDALAAAACNVASKTGFGTAGTGTAAIAAGNVALVDRVESVAAVADAATALTTSVVFWRLVLFSSSLSLGCPLSKCADSSFMTDSDDKEENLLRRLLPDSKSASAIASYR